MCSVVSLRRLLPAPLWFAQGMLAGFGAVLPGVSGGTLCVVFGMYRPLIGLFHAPMRTVKAQGGRLFCFAAGIAAGFVGLSGVAARLLAANAAAVSCAFAGFVMGTVPSLWRDARKQGPQKGSLAALALGLGTMLAALLWLQRAQVATLPATFGGYLLCGVLWGLSFIVPGLSSSSLLLFFGIYGPMLAGISRLDAAVLLPMGLGAGGCILLLSRAVAALYRRFYTVTCHAVLGIVIACALSVLPTPASLAEAAFFAAVAVCGALFSFVFSRLCTLWERKAQEV